MRTAFKARYVFPVASPPIADGVVTIDAGRIIAVGRQAVRCHTTDLGNVAILPGLINAHTHLEFSGLNAPLGTPGMSLPDWIRLVAGYRRQVSPASNSIHIARGLMECWATGTVALGDIATTAGSFPSNLEGNERMDTTIFLESIGLRQELIESRLAASHKYLSDGAAQCWRHGLSPHAPYSIHPRLFDGLLNLASQHKVPLAFHLAETLEELDLLATGGGPFRELLIGLGAWDETAIPRGTRPIEYLHALVRSDVQALIIHANYLDDEEIRLVASHPDRLTVVYCPRTHAYFGHAPHPLPKLLAAGANVALGTDSRASNPDLDLLEEIRFVARRFPELPSGLPLELGTLMAARAMELEHRLGTIEPDKDAAMVSVPLANGDATDPHLLIYESTHSASPVCVT